MTGPGIARTMVGSAAWDERDVADARRRRPDINLAAWAARRDLHFHGNANTSGWSAVLPGEPELQFNVVRGTSQGGRDVCLWHCRHPLPLVWGPGGPTLEDERHHDLRLQVPIQGGGRQLRIGHVGLPCTAAGVAVPEAALLPTFAVTLRAGVLQPTPEPVAGLLAGGLGQLLRIGSRHAVFELTSWFGMLLLRRNGYADDAGMDEMLAMLDDGARALRNVAGPRGSHLPFNTRLPTAAWPPREHATQQSSPLLEQVQRLARRYRMQHEDPRHYHRAFPTVPVPGTAWAVLRGSLPGIAPVARIALHTEAPLPEGVGRTALLLPAGDVPATEPGGVQVHGSPVPLRYAVADGIFAAWVIRNGASGLGSMAALLGPGPAVAARLGVPVA